MRLIMLDTETSGIPDRDPLTRILEVGAVVVDWTESGIELGATFESLCNPGRLFWDRPECRKALDVNLLTPDMIDDARPRIESGRHYGNGLRHRNPMP